MAHKDAPYLKPKERRAHAVSMATELLGKTIDVAAVKQELLIPFPRPEVADRVFLRALRAITLLEADNIALKEQLANLRKSDQR